MNLVCGRLVYAAFPP
ncbi:hypothetical protein K6U72_09310 [Vibrio furnissii]|nr:hypothetical protein [Vibrio furnissii]MCG6258763.1 hypothetical protein [Vibrio furnissii]